ncbi:MAG TPA: hypothetical protein ACFYD1_06100 [Candidatus Hypogeohydataceae bacterium YC38]|nr:hypothetical protein [Candidatus Brocadiales bacterium]
MARGRLSYLWQKLEEGWGKLRRFYLVHYREDYVQGQVRWRQGACRRCGSCCRIMFRCPHLITENQCSIYYCRYKQCKAFPIDDRDLKYLRHTCGFSFLRPKEARFTQRAS